MYSPNPLVYLAVASNVVVGADTISILPNVPYRAWNAARRQVEECVCTNYTVVTADTAAFADGRWYVVTGMVSAANLTVDGAAHLILCGDAMLTATGGENLAGVAVANDNALTIYGQANGTGELVAKGGCAAAGIGANSGEKGGAVTVNGGTVTATGRGMLPEGSRRSSTSNRRRTADSSSIRSIRRTRTRARPVNSWVKSLRSDQSSRPFAKVNETKNE